MEESTLREGLTLAVVAVRTRRREARHHRTRATLAAQATGWVKPLVTLAGGIINGRGTEVDVDVDYIMTH